MAARSGLRISFAIGAVGIFVSIALGGVATLLESGRPPPLARHPLEPARDALAAGEGAGLVKASRMFVALQPRDARVHLRLVEALVRSGDEVGAIQVLEGVLALRPVPPAAHAMLANLYARQGRLEDARVQARRARELGVQLGPELRRRLGLRRPPA